MTRGRYTYFLAVRNLKRVPGIDQTPATNISIRPTLLGYCLKKLAQEATSGPRGWSRAFNLQFKVLRYGKLV
jgi:hypothetical protein